MDIHDVKVLVFGIEGTYVATQLLLSNGYDACDRVVWNVDVLVVAYYFPFFMSFPNVRQPLVGEISTIGRTSIGNLVN